MKFTLFVITLISVPVWAQETLRLETLEQQARNADPRVRQLELEAARTDLSLRNIAAERRPSFSVEGQAQYQSDVPQLPFAGAPSIPKDTYDASVRVDQSILDPSVRARAAIERARLAETQAGIHTALYALRQEVDEAFFTAALLQEREAQIATTITDLEARLSEAKARVREGAALPGDAASIEATLLLRQEDVTQLRANRRAALARLSELTGRPITAVDVLTWPDLGGAVADARKRLEDLRLRPEYERFARVRDRLEAQKDIFVAQEKPRFSAYGRAGYGQPGINFLNGGFDTYWLAGVRVQWKPWNWGTAAREQKALELQEESIKADEDAFTKSLRKSVQNDVATVDYLQEVLALDERIVALRELIERETRARFNEQVVTAADYVDKTTDVLEARLARATHRVELAQARARLLTILGVEVR